MSTDFRPAPGHTDEVRYAVQGPIGRVRLNRPAAINALTRPMVRSLLDRLRAWADDPAVQAVLVDGAGDRGLCAGGDVRALREVIAAGHVEEALGFWEDEYALNALVADYPKPYVAWMDGVVMGGGVGISAHGSHRWVTPRARVAMPETAIGFFPDVGGLWFLSRAPGELGTHVALTGLPVSAADAVLLGLADRVVDADDPLPLVEELLDGRGPAPGGPAPEAPLQRDREWIDACYAGDDPAEILRRLEEHPDPAAREAGAVLASRSPFAVAVTLEALRRAAALDVHEVLAQDRALGPTFARHPDFAEGVRALLVDKDRSPRWQPPTLAEVRPEDVLAAFGA